MAVTQLRPARRRRRGPRPGWVARATAIGAIAISIAAFDASAPPAAAAPGAVTVASLAAPAPAR